LTKALENRKTIEDQLMQFQDLDKSAVSVDQKLDELILLLKQSNLDSTTVAIMQRKMNQAFDDTKFNSLSLRLFQGLDDKNSSRLEMADDLENLLSTYAVDSKASKRFLMAEKLMKFVLMLTSLGLMILGYALIVMPATAEFEMFTIFYFTTDDGFTLMDLIALLIVFTGVYLFIRSVVKFNWQD